MSEKYAKVVQYQWSNLKNQYLAAFVANIIFFSNGAMIAWISPALLVLLSENSPLGASLTNEQVSWLGSLGSFSAIPGTFIFSTLAVWLGCKRAMLLLTFPALTSWLLIFFGTTYYHVLVARFFQGCTAGGIMSTIILYIADIANDNIRGRLGSISHFTQNLGVLCGFIVGAIVEYETVPCIFASVPIIFGISFFFLPNTPQFYLKKGQENKAEDALRFYKGCAAENIDENVAIFTEFERLKSVVSERKKDDKIHLKDFLNRRALKGILNGVILASCSHFSGFLIFITYASLIFETVGATQISPSISSICLAVLQLVGTMCAARFSDSLGRRRLLIISLLGSSFGMVSFALYSYLKQNGYTISAFEWVPVTSLSFLIFISAAGIVPSRILVTVESMPSKIRPVGLAIGNVFFSITSFTCLKLFPILMVKIGLHSCMLILAAFCALGSLYVLFVLKETKGISLDTVLSQEKKSTETLETIVNGR